MKPFEISEVTGLEDNFEYFELSEDDMALINKARQYCATEKEIQSGDVTLKQTRWQAHVVISDGQLAATNAYILFFKDIPIKSKDKVLLRAEAIDAIGVNKCKLYLGGQSQVQLESEEMRVGFKSPEVFPNWRALILDQFNTMLSVSYKDFYEALQGCKSTGVSHFDISVSDGQLSLRSENTETGSSFERFLQDDVIVSGADNKVKLNIRFIERMMKADKSETINIDILDGSHLIRINGHSVLMPIIA
jgi:DNA polymerase III sliding clamp (beta) subunit (PCNA family)